MAFTRRLTTSDQIWNRAWTADALSDLVSISAILGPNGARHGDIAFVTATGFYYLWLDNGQWAIITGIPTLAAANIYSANQTISKTNPQWRNEDPGGGANAKLTAWDGTAGDFSFQFLNDDGTFLSEVWNAIRSTGAAQFQFDLETVGDFRADQGVLLGAGTDALDEYEEDVFTPDLTFGGLSTGITYTFRQFSYTKVGRQVCVCGLIVLSNKGSATGDVAFTLPFTVANGSQFASANGMNFDALAVTVNNALASCINNTNTAFIFQTAAGTTARLNDTHFTNTSVLVIQVNFFV